MTTRVLQVASGILLAFGIGAASAEPAYIDDRSSPETLVRSLYNAINRQEYARAYAYFDPPPADTVEAYAQGFADTQSVEVVTGSASSDGAAGTIYYALPVAIRSQMADGMEQVFAGCYTMAFVQPAVQTTPYRPLSIEEGHLEAADGPPEAALPSSCGDGAPSDQGLLTEKAKRLFSTLYGNVCGSETEQEPENHAIRFNYPHEPADTPQHEVRLFRFPCQNGAHNETHAYFMADENGAVLPLRFAVPELDIRYQDNDTNGPVEEMRIIGYTAKDLLAGSNFDPQTLEITSQERWRGQGDASSSAIWLFRSGAFSLVRYAVDASYDGQANPELLLDYHSGP